MSWNEYGYHTFGIDWVSQVGAGYGDAEEIQDTNVPSESRANRSKSPTYMLKHGYTYSVPPTRPYDGRGTSVMYVGYGHHDDTGYDNPNHVAKKGDKVSLATTNRLAEDANLGPHLHLYLSQNWDATNFKGTNYAAWQERYFPPMAEIPLAVYLTAVCRYGWTRQTFGSYTWDWAKGLNLGSGCMRQYNLPETRGLAAVHTLGICAQACQSAAAYLINSGDTESDCATATGDASFYETYFTYKTGNSCTSKCDDKFSEFLLNYWYSLESEMYTTEWLEWTYDDPRHRYPLDENGQPVNWPVESGFRQDPNGAIGTGEWVYNGGVAQSLTDWGEAFGMLWGIADQYLGAADAPAREWYDSRKGGTISDDEWNNTVKIYCEPELEQ